MIVYLLLWGVVSCASGTNVSTSLDISGHHHVFPSDDGSAFDFNQTIKDVIALTESEQAITEILTKIIGTSKIIGNEKFISFDPVGSAINAASLATSLAAFTLQSAQFAYQKKEDIKNAKAAEKHALEENSHWTIMEEANKKMIESLDQINDEIKKAATKITEAILRNLFDERVTLHLFILYSKLELMLKTMDPLHVTEFINSCEKTPPLDSFYQLVLLADQMFEQQMKGQYDQSKFFGLINLYLLVANQFYFVYPHCSTFLYNANASAINETMLDAIKKVDNVLKQKSFDRQEMTLASANIPKLFKAVYNPNANKVENFESYYNQLMITFGGMAKWLKKDEKSYIICQNYLEYEYSNMHYELIYVAEGETVFVFEAPSLNRNLTCEAVDSAKFCKAWDKYSGSNYLASICHEYMSFLTFSCPVDYKGKGYCAEQKAAPEFTLFKVRCGGEGEKAIEDVFFYGSAK